jgi:hypothetical protein
MTKPKPHQAACEFCGRQFLRIKSPYCPECREYLHNLDAKKRYHKAHAVSEEDFARRMEGVTERRELVAHFVGVVPGADDDAPYFVGRKLYWTEVKTAAPGFLPDGLIVQTYNGRHVVQGGRLVKYQEGETNS